MVGGPIWLEGFHLLLEVKHYSEIVRLAIYIVISRATTKGQDKAKDT